MASNGIGLSDSRSALTFVDDMSPVTQGLHWLAPERR